LLAARAEHEIADRGRRRIERHLAEARLLVGKTFDSFGFDPVPVRLQGADAALAAGGRTMALVLLFGPPPRYRRRGADE